MIEEMNKSLVDRFLEERVKEIDGHVIPLSEIWSAFKIYVMQVEPAQMKFWTQRRFNQNVPLLKGRQSHNAQWAFANVSLTDQEPKAKYELDGDKLVQC